MSFFRLLHYALKRGNQEASRELAGLSMVRKQGRDSAQIQPCTPGKQSGWTQQMHNYFMERASVSAKEAKRAPSC